MKKRSSILRKISNIFGITLMLLGFVPVPGISQVSGVYANIDNEESRAAWLPELSTTYSALLGSNASLEDEVTLALPQLTAGFIGDSIRACEGDDCTSEIVTDEQDPSSEISAPASETPPDETPAAEDTQNEPEQESQQETEQESGQETQQEPEQESGQETQQEPEQDSELKEIDVQGEVNALAGAGGVLLDENDQPIPLTSEEALETLSVADPYFTEGGVKSCFVPSGTCAGSCNVCNVSATPIQDAINAASAGTTVYMEQGAQFTESFTINKSITLTADGGNMPIIKSSNGEYIVKIENTDNVSIFDLKFDGEGDSDVIGVWIVNSGNILLQGNEIVDTAVAVQVDNPANTTKKVRIYENTIKSDTSGSVGIQVNTIGDGSLFASLNTIQSDQYNVLDNSGKEDFELFFNDWGYIDGGGNYQICSITGHTISDWTQLYNCALLSNVLNSEAFLDGSLYPDVFEQGLEGNGGLCIAEKNDTYAIKLDQPNSGTISLGAGESLGAVGIKSGTSCYYAQAPTTVNESITVNGKDGSPCYQVTLTENNQGNLEYYYEKIGDGNGCQDISHMVGYYGAPEEEEEEPEFEPLSISLVCLGDGQFSWRVANPNDVAATNVQVKVDGNVVYSGSISANSSESNTVNVNTASPTVKMEAFWAGNGYAMTETDVCKTSELEDLQLSLVCLGGGQVSWNVSNPNDAAVSNVVVKLDGSIVFQGSISANGDIDDVTASGVGLTTKMEVSWEENGYAMSQIDACLDTETQDLQLNMVCLGVGQFAWSVTNPNDFEVQNVQVLLDGSLVFDGTLAANATAGLGVTSDGPASHTMVVTWEEQGEASLTSNIECESTFTPPPQDPPIPVTGTQFLIPVTGLDLASAPFLLRAGFIAGGSSILALSYALLKRKQD